MERLFSVFDTNTDEFLDLKEFLEGMIILFTESYENLLGFIFKLYDFDRDDLITREDIRVVLSYIPLNKNLFQIGKDEFLDRVESQDELHSLLEKCFKNLECMNHCCFKFVTENVSSDLFLFPLIYILSQRPFSMRSLAEYEEKKNLSFIGKRLTKTQRIKIINPMSRNKRSMIASPNIYSKFSPSFIIRKSPFWNSRKILDTKKNSLHGITHNFLTTEINAKNKSLNSRHHELLNQLMIGKSKESSNEIMFI
jgi:hypothetical protein